MQSTRRGVYSYCINRTGPMFIPASTLTDASLSMMITDLCAQHVKLTGALTERNADRLKQLCTEQARRAA